MARVSPVVVAIGANFRARCHSGSLSCEHGMYRVVQNKTYGLLLGALVRQTSAEGWLKIKGKKGVLGGCKFRILSSRRST